MIWKQPLYQTTFILLFAALGPWAFPGAGIWPWALALWVALVPLSGVLEGRLFLRRTRRKVGEPSSEQSAVQATQIEGLGWEITEKERMLSIASGIIAINLDSMATNIQRISTNAEVDSAAMAESSAALVELSQTSDSITLYLEAIAGDSRVMRQASERANPLFARVSEQMSLIDQNSKRIGRIVQTITEIARNTNMLSLNAAIEAAKAQEQGKGFSVVAAEVRNLAVKSNQAATEIRELIDTMLEGIGKGVEALGSLSQELLPTFQRFSTLDENIQAIDLQVQEQNKAVAEATQVANQLARSIFDNGSYITELKQISAAGAQGLDLMGEIGGFLSEVARKRSLPGDRLEAGRAFAWKPEFSVGLETIDAQHRILIDMIDWLLQAGDRGAERPELANMIQGLYRYSVAHFDFEEAVMKRLHHPKFKEHKALHTKFLDQLKQQIEDFKRSQLGLEEIIQALRQWLIGHIQAEDPQYVKLFRDGGIL